MDDSQELKFTSTPQELLKLEQSDLCVTLYTIWDRMRDRGEIAGRHLISCRNDSCVPDTLFGEFSRRALVECESVLNHGELFVLSSVPFAQFKESVSSILRAELDSL
jgi:hypothetical protein